MRPDSLAKLDAKVADKFQRSGSLSRRRIRCDSGRLMKTPPPAPFWELLLEDGPLLAVNKSAGLLTQGVPHKLPALEWLADEMRR